MMQTDFKVVFDQHKDAVYRFAWRMTNSPYVLHEPAWKPSYPNADTAAFLMGTADRAEWVIGK
jgi:hypothetical protein